MDEVITPELIMEDLPEDMASMDEYMGEDFSVSTDMGDYAGYGDPTMAVDPGALAFMAGLGIVMSLVSLFIIAVTIIAWWKIFVKAGRPGWAAIVPFYNIFVLLEIVGMNGWWMLLFVGMFIPVLNIIFAVALMVLMIVVNYRLSISFGKGVGFAIGLFFLSPIFLLILAFGSARYTGSVARIENDNAPQPQPPQQPQM